jgi:hypothetical protein
MTCPVGESRARSRSPLRCAISVASVLAVASAFGVPSTSAAPPGEVAGAAGAMVKSAGAAGVAIKSVTSIPAPPPPKAPLPATASDPVARPSAPQVPLNPVELPTDAAPASSHAATGPPGNATKISGAGADLPLVDGIASGTKGSAGAVAEASKKPIQQISAPAGRGYDADSDRQSTPGGDPAISGDRERSIGAAKAAPPAWFFAYVWPAIALSQNEGPLTTFLLGLRGGSFSVSEAAARFPIPEVARGSLGVKGIARSGGDSPSSAHSGSPNALLATPFDGALPTGAQILLYVAMAALLAGLALAIPKELGVALRLPGRRR